MPDYRCLKSSRLESISEFAMRMLPLVSDDREGLTYNSCMANSHEPVVVTDPLLDTKLYVPRLRSGLVSRPRLVQRLNRVIDHKLTLISAPAGFGKSTILTEWLAASPLGENAVGWVSLDQSDNNPVIFWSYFITAIQKCHPGIGDQALSMLHSPQNTVIELVLTTLINEIGSIENDFVLILDDFHVIDSLTINNAVAFLIEHAPPQLHLVVATRSDPPLPIASLRARGESIELRASDLNFQPDEAAIFLNDTMGLDLSASDVAALETRTEGWIAGLQLAALSIRGREDVSQFISDFAGDDRFIVDYLVEEVLQRQSEQIRSFLLQTSVLDTLSGSLCNAVTERHDGREVLEALERANLFVIPLDNTRQLYRYHHLFADVLHAHLKEEDPGQVTVLHKRASEWFEENSFPIKAVNHAFASEDFNRAADLVELAWSAMNKSYRASILLEWVKALPDEHISVRPVLSVGYAWALLGRADLESAEARLCDAEKWLDSSTNVPEDISNRSEKMVVADEKQFRFLPAMIASARAYHAQALGDVPNTIVHSERALELMPKDEYFERGVILAILGLAYWTTGDLDSAFTIFADGVENMRLSGNTTAVVTGTFTLAGIKKAQGHLHEAYDIYQRSLQLLAEHCKSVIRGTADLHVGLSELHRERGELEAAEKCLLTAEELGEHAALPEMPYRSRTVALARLKEAQGDLNGALELLIKAEHLVVRGPVPIARPIGALKARIWLRQGRLDDAIRWTEDRGLSTEDHLDYVREFEHITLARVLIARYASDGASQHLHAATGLLERLLEKSVEGGRTENVIEILLIQAMSNQTQGEIARAVAIFERALVLAEPEGYVQVFVDEGEAMLSLIRYATANGVTNAHAMRLLFELRGTHPSASPSAPVASSELAEALTAREVEILRLIATGMRNQEVADHLFISISTVKRHIANAYGKLNVGHRTEAIARANELHLL